MVWRWRLPRGCTINTQFTGPLFNEECKVTEGKGPARRVAEQTGQKTGNIPGERGKEANDRRDRKGRAGRATGTEEALCVGSVDVVLAPLCWLRGR